MCHRTQQTQPTLRLLNDENVIISACSEGLFTIFELQTNCVLIRYNFFFQYLGFYFDIFDNYL